MLSFMWVIEMIIGSHVHFKNKQILDSVKEAIEYNANTFMFYTGAPQNTIRSSINKEYLEEAKKLMHENNIDINNVICHAPYIINLANNLEESKYNFSKEFLRKELDRCEELEVNYLVLHPGSSVKIDRGIAIDNIVNGINEITNPNDKCIILLETMAGKGTEIGKTLEEIAYIVKHVNNKIGVCLDTCHLNDSGIDLNDFDDYLDEFDKLIGIDKIKCVHINDSKNIIGSHKDRHENIGIGTIGFDTLLSIINNPRLEKVPKILETPYVLDKAPYKYEIEMIRKGEFNPNLIDDITNN